MSQKNSQIADQRARNVLILAHAKRVADVYSLEHAADAGTSGAELPLFVVPSNTRSTTPLPDEAREEFLTRLEGVVAKAFLSPVRNNAEPMTAQEDSARRDAGWLPVPQDPLPTLLGGSCATCRGECCTAGGTHGFLYTDSLVRVRAQLVDGGETPTEASVVAQYAACLPTRHYRGSCVYHTTKGCALTRELRSNLCNRFACSGLAELISATAAAPVTAAYVASADSVHLRRVSLVTLTSARAVPLTA